MQFCLTKDKRPLNPLTLDPAGITDETIYLTADQAASLAQQYGVEVGGVIAPPYFLIDIDHCYDGREWSQLAAEMVNRFRGAYVEVSKSGDGLHIIGKIQGNYDHRCKNIDLQIECYTEKRLVALTGKNAHGHWDTEHDAQFQRTIGEYFPPKHDLYSHEWTNKPVKEWAGPDDDGELIERALKSKSTAGTFGARATFADLWGGKAEDLAHFYPSVTKDFDRSSADLALCSHLAFWTGKNCERIERLFAQSGLMRDKWKDRQDYRHDSIMQAINNCKNVYNGGKPRESQADGVRHGLQVLTIDEQVEYFKGCAYIADLDKVITPKGVLLNSKQFKAMYGGYLFYIDSLFEKTTKNAFEAFTESQAYDFPKCESTTFKPLEPPGTIIERNGIKLYNLWRDLNVPCEPGDVSPFLYLLERLLPDARDRDILLSYLSAAVRYQGVKFQWWPVIQGVKGNGKNFIAYATMEAIGREHCHIPKAEKIANQFNGWMQNKTFIFVDEIDIKHRVDIEDSLKPLITNERIESERKGVDQAMIENLANGIMCMNAKDGIKRRSDERRYCVFFTAQQDTSDLVRDGLNGDFFPNLWNWARTGGYAHITHFLRTYDINPEFNPAKGCHRAPETSTNDEVLAQAYSYLQEKILDAVDECVPGACEGWLSSDVIQLIQENDKRVTKSSRKVAEDVLKLGYIRHPALANGRSPISIPWTGRRPRLYIKSESPDATITDANTAVTKFIQKQQEYL